MGKGVVNYNIKIIDHVKNKYVVKKLPSNLMIDPRFPISFANVRRVNAVWGTVKGCRPWSIEADGQVIGFNGFFNFFKKSLKSIAKSLSTNPFTRFIKLGKLSWNCKFYNC